MGVSWKDSAKYLLYFAGFVIILVISGNVFHYFHSIQQATYELVPWSIYATLSYMSIGIYLGLPKLWKEFGKVGKWNINLSKLLLIGFPALYLSFYWYFPFSYPIPELLKHTSTFFGLGGTILVGYTIMDSFVKKQITKANS